METLKGAMSVGQARRAATLILETAGLEEPAAEARLLIGAASGLSHSELIIAANDPLSNAALNALKTFIKQRLTRRPISDILGYKDFWKDRFIISKDVLTPRPETEGIITAALTLFSTEQTLNILDLGTGSGAIILSLLREFPKARGLGIDISEDALKIARSNCAALDLDCEFRLGNWLEGLSGPFDLIVSNPPYITQTEMQDLEIDVSDYDPGLALFGGEDGLEPYRHILSEFTKTSPLGQNGTLIFEVGHRQARRVSEMMIAKGFDPRVHKDLSGIDRIISAKRGEK